MNQPTPSEKNLVTENTKLRRLLELRSLIGDYLGGDERLTDEDFGSYHSEAQALADELDVT